MDKEIVRSLDNLFLLTSVSSWRNNWPQLSTYLKNPEEIRKIICTANAIENFNRGLRKVTKAKSIFPSDDALIKEVLIYLSSVVAATSGPDTAAVVPGTTFKACEYNNAFIQY